MDNVLDGIGKLMNNELDWPGFWDRLHSELKKQPWWDEKLVQSLQEPKDIFSGLAEKMGIAELKSPLIVLLLMRFHSQQRVNELLPSSENPPDVGSGVSDRLLAEACHFLRVSDLVYKSNPEEAGIARRDLLLNVMSDEDPNFDASLPRHAVFVDHLTRNVIVVVRGTMTLRDVISDLVAIPAPVLDGRGHSHKGIAKHAEDMLPTVMPVLRKALESLPGYKIVLTGHSLGAGVAIMIALCLRHRAREWSAGLPEGALADMSVFAFAPPPVWTPLDSLSPDDVANIHVFVNNSDIVPRSTMRNLEVTVNCMKHIDRAIAGLDSMQLMKVVAGMEGDEQKVREVLEVVGEAVDKSDRDAEAGLSGEGGGEEFLHEQLFHPGRIFHLFPTAPNNQEEDARLRMGKGTLPADTYELQELPADRLALAHAVEGDSFVSDHLTEGYIKALQRLERSTRLQLSA
mmetsp:Transcript_20428/g.48631  ORF Transcript_20428/g.48631 Transcript_20428/m.48631 type:complete len:458 (-) Transcript_20428:174-1547(-)|eukprot:CAMPEP_0177618762 /NCGR_PEP_ID=MMETSP0419_2-20121207/25799_1 /TAXON_ID=582737 /ORGANISM="Tetraselmis sp., Strain GSL018" /LENGTH=457 /DNA_ID=CAMNT_0019117783 /DNA_START=335 /DNA_END=1708 /DNA_ORIENTATION=-